MLLMDQISISRLARGTSQGDLTGPLAKLHRNGFCPGSNTERPGASPDQLVDAIISGGAESANPNGTFDTMTEGVKENDLIAAGYVLGICPRFLGLIQPPLASYCELLCTASGREISKETVVGLGNSLLMEGRR
jgi:hypothetical protein